MSLPLLITRPEPAASATAARARARGLTASVTPLFELRALAWQPPSPEAFDAVIVTSTNALRFGARALQAYHHLPLLAVGDASAVAACDAGFADVSAGVCDGQALVELAAQAGYRRILHPCGHAHKSLHHADVVITPVPVYAAEAIDPPPALPFDGPMVAAVYSPRAAARLAEIVRDRSQTHLLTISAAAAEAAGIGWSSIHSAEAPTEAAMLALAAQICEQ